MHEDAMLLESVKTTSIKMRVLKNYVENKTLFETIVKNKVIYCKTLRDKSKTTKNVFPLCQIYKPAIILN